MFKAVIFDLDGVLVDSQPFHFDVDIEVLGAFGYACTLEQAQKYAGMALDTRIDCYINDLGVTVSVRDFKACHIVKIMELLEKSSLRPAAGVVGLLSLLKEKRIPMSVASSSSPAFINKMLEKLEIAGYFDFIVSGENMPRGKPAPDIFLAASKMHGLPAADCAVIEDSSSGVAAAKAAGAFCVGYINPTSGEQDLSAADLTVHDFAQLIENFFGGI